MKGFKGFLIFVIVFSACFGLAYALCPVLTPAIAGGGLAIAYTHGEKR